MNAPALLTKTSCRVNSINLTSTQLRLQSFEIRLEDKSWVGTLIRQNLDYILKKIAFLTCEKTRKLFYRFLKQVVNLLCFIYSFLWIRPSDPARSPRIEVFRDVIYDCPLPRIEGFLVSSPSWREDCREVDQSSLGCLAWTLAKWNQPEIKQQ